MFISGKALFCRHSSSVEANKLLARNLNGQKSLSTSYLQVGRHRGGLVEVSSPSARARAEIETETEANSAQRELVGNGCATTCPHEPRTTTTAASSTNTRPASRSLPTVCFATRVFTFSLDALVSLFQDEFEMHHVVS